MSCDIVNVSVSATPHDLFLRGVTSVIGLLRFIFFPNSPQLKDVEFTVIHNTETHQVLMSKNQRFSGNIHEKLLK